MFPDFVDTSGLKPPADLFIRRREWIRGFLAAGAVVADVLTIGVAALAAGRLLDASWMSAGMTGLFLAICPVYVLAAIGVNGLRLATLRSGSASVHKSLVSLGIAAACLFGVVFALQVGNQYSRMEAGLFLLLAACFLVLARLLGAFLLRLMQGAIEEQVVILTDGAGGTLGPRRGNAEISLQTAPPSSDPNFLDRLFRTIQHADRVIVSFSDSELRAQWVRLMGFMGVHAEVIEPTLGDVAPLGINRWQDTPTLVIARAPLRLHERAVKRTFDLALTLAVLPVLAPIIIILMLAVKLETPGPALFVQERVGKNNRRYRCYKLRSMRAESSDTAGNRSTTRDDNRVTAVGRFLRNTSLDELPQLLNVLKGDMSLVGPRPHAVGSTAEGALFWEVVPTYWARHAAKPGITGLAQVRGHRGATLSREDLERRVSADLEYINRWSLWLDIVVLARTLQVLVHRNAF